jgi:hypothetical protein
MGFFETFILSLFDTGMTMLLINSMLKSVKLNLLSKIIYIIATSICIALISKLDINDILAHFLCTAIGLLALCIYLFFNGIKNKVTSFLIYITVSLMLIVFQLVGVIILNVFIGNVIYTFKNGIFAQSICLVSVIIIITLIPLSLLDIFIRERNAVFSIITTTSFILYYGITILWYIDVNNINNIVIEIFFMVLFAIAINTVILREGFLSRIYKEKLSIYDTYFPIINEMIEELRSKQHDYHNQIQTILAMKKNELTSEKDIEDYLDELNNNSVWNDLLKLDNRILSAFLYSKIIEGKNKNINIDVTISSFNNPSIYSSYQLVEMYGILIDNAIEAVDAKDSENYIKIFIYREDDMNVFEIRNNYKYVSVAEINTFFNKGYSTKNNGMRGIGLYKLKLMLRSQKGIIAFYYDTEWGQVIVKIHHY